MNEIQNHGFKCFAQDELQHWKKILTLNVFRGNLGEIMETLWLTCKPATQFHTGFQKAQSVCVHSPSSWVTQKNSSLYSRVRYANSKESVCVCVSLQPCSSSHDSVFWEHLCHRLLFVQCWWQGDMKRVGL